MTFLCAVTLLLAAQAGDDVGGKTPEERAVAFLAREVPAWSQKNRCFSCHNNGDAARALFVATRHSLAFDPQALTETTDWLVHPGRWKDARTPAEFRDDRLSAIQFAAALAQAIETGRNDARGALLDAAQQVAAAQDADGSWHVDISAGIGSPATYGPALATWSACRTLTQADAKRFENEIAQANEWFLNLNIQNVPQAASVLLALAGRTQRAAEAQRRRALDLVRRGQSSDGAWGPYVHAPPEVFDTSIALLALAANGNEPGVAEWRDAGRKFLVGQQLDDGSWPETTRPPGGRSYAQRLSTSSWATMALLETPASR